MVYAIDPKEMLRVDRAAQALGADIIGVFHSHTHTDAYPSPTDVAQAPDPGWHYVLVSLRDTHPVVRSYRIVDGRHHRGAGRGARARGPGPGAPGRGLPAPCRIVTRSVNNRPASSPMRLSTVTRH